MADANRDIPFEWQPIRIQTSGTLTASDIAPFLDEVHKHHQWIDLSLPALGNEPPAADFTEIAIVIAIPVSAAAWYAKTFIETWAAEDAKALRLRLIKAANKGVRRRSEGAARDFVPLQIRVAGSRYVMREIANEAELQIALRALQSQVEDRNQPSESEARPYHLSFWDPKEKRWT